MSAALALKLTPPTVRRIENFRANRRGYWSLWLFLGLFFLSLFAEMIANDKPLLIRHEGKFFAPFLFAYAETDFGGDFPTEADYRDPYLKNKIAADGGRTAAIHVDVTDEKSVERAIVGVVSGFGGLDVLINCAGGYGRLATVEDMPTEEWDRTIALNLLHPFLSCRHGIPHLIKAGGGSIINVTSHLGLMGSIRPAYAATKGGPSLSAGSVAYLPRKFDVSAWNEAGIC
jgi:hypothetical protein